MTIQFVFANNVNTTIAAPVATGDTSITIASSANLPTLTANQKMPLTLNDKNTGLVYEVVYVTAISGVTLTVQRAQEGTSAQAWALGDYAFCSHTANTTFAVGDYASDVNYTQGSTGASIRTVQNKLQEQVSVLDFGADPTGAANATTAFNNALAASNNVYVPAGTYLLDNLTLPTGCLSFKGQAMGSVTFTPSAAVTTGAFVSYTGTNPIEVSGFTLGTTTTVVPLQITNAVGAHVSRIHVTSSGPTSHSLELSSCTASHVSECKIDDPGYDGIVLSICNECSVYSNTVLSPNSAQHGIQLYQGLKNKVYGNYVERTSTSNGFGISVWETSSNSVFGNIISPNQIEGINIDSGNRNSITGNLIVCASGHHDFGISVFAQTANCDQNTIVGNTVYNSGKAGVALASSTSFYCNYSLVEANSISNPCQNQLAGEPHAALYIYGNSSASFNVIQGNTVGDGTSQVNYVAYEAAGINTLLKDNPYTGAALTSENYIVGTGSKAFDLIPVTFTSTVSSGTGTLTTASGTVKYVRRGNYLKTSAALTVTTNGTGATSLRFTLPFNASGTISGRENSVTGKTVMGNIPTGGSTVSLWNYDNTYPAADGTTFVLTGDLFLG
jgi:parallel beta-helix repeat protein